MPGGESAQPGASTPPAGVGKAGEHKGGAPTGVGRGQRRTAAFSWPNPLGCKPTQFAAGRPGQGQEGGSFSPSPTARFNASGRAQHLQSLENHAPFPKGKAKCKSLSQTHISSSAVRKVVKALISELGGRDNDTSAAPRAQRKKTSILGLHQRPPRFLPPWL